MEIGLSRGLGGRFRFRFGRGFFALDVGVATAAFFNFIVLLSHNSLLCEIDSFLYRFEI